MHIASASLKYGWLIKVLSLLSPSSLLYYYIMLIVYTINTKIIIKYVTYTF